MFNNDKDIFHLYINRRYKGKRLSSVILGYRSHKYFLINLVKSFFKELFATGVKLDKTDYSSLTAKKWIYITTQNNYETLKFLEPVTNTVMVGYEPTFEGKVVTLGRKNLRIFSWSMYAFLVYLYLSPRHTAMHYKMVLRYYFIKTYYERLIRENRPDCIFISNDHFPKSRALINVAMRQGIKVFYFQHASISNKFPPLNFTASFLYGAYSRDLYQSFEGTKGDIYLIGNHKYDDYQDKMRRTKMIETIGIAFNTVDDIPLVNQLIADLKRSYPGIDLWIRPHPADKRSIGQMEQVHYSDPVKENSLEFLSRMDVIISNKSSILLEGAILNVMPVQYPLSEIDRPDPYQFVNFGLCQWVKDFGSLKQVISQGREEGFIYREKAKVFDESIGSSFEYKSQDKALQILSDQYDIT